MSTNHSTPLRRISHGSLSQSHQASTSSPTQLDFLAQPLADLVDEIDALHQNLVNINALSDSLGAFNEGFATFLYGMRMNAFSVEWPQAPTELSFDLHDQTIIHPPPPPSLIPRSSANPPSSSDSYRTPSSPSTTTLTHPGDATYATQYSLADDPAPPQTPAAAAPATRGIARGRGRGIARGGRAGGAAGAGGVAARKAREAKINAIVETLPLEFRGSDPVIRQAVEKVITSLLLKPAGLKMVELTSPPELPHARVNKCLIALVGKKIVQKVNEGGTTIYQLV
ncbi:DASH complex subunit Dam1-domain-containing protein [Mrakia frigida]|uniref:Dam1p n=1 Tax=Mrakia frigida TaxID=29902 RepID=UPI003FCC213E